MPFTKKPHRTRPTPSHWKSITKTCVCEKSNVIPDSSGAVHLVEVPTRLAGCACPPRQPLVLERWTCIPSTLFKSCRVPSRPYGKTHRHSRRSSPSPTARLTPVRHNARHRYLLGFTRLIREVLAGLVDCAVRYGRAARAECQGRFICRFGHGACAYDASVKQQRLRSYWNLASNKETGCDIWRARRHLTPRLPLSPEDCRQDPCERR